ncbi:37S ribosomal protein S35 [Escovopsis weberi]|uniref:37S ribosomal protein S35 n=1 Tax=Escovopsis weberi TaxID=150374 RepID=A0A0M9VUA8_ESCWE|nr:37S ribosomal protein S35 [Escovopsis weberi]
MLPPAVAPAAAAAAALRGPGARRAFSTTPPAEKMSRARQLMFAWLKGREGAELAAAPSSAGARGPRYLAGGFADQPFPLNPLFRSQPVLDDAARELVWARVVQKGESLKGVSAEFGIDVRRVAAVVRLKEVEKQWVAQGKKLALPYASAVMKMLPTTSLADGRPNPPHEPVNEVHVHKLTMQQLFVPVGESRRFTRADAAAAFHRAMLPADARSPQPQLIAMERALRAGASRAEGAARFRADTQREEDAVARRIERLRIAEERRTTRVQSDRCEFRFKEINADHVGRDGRSRRGTGWRYGAPLEDRKRGMVKIPTSVP